MDKTIREILHDFLIQYAGNHHFYILIPPDADMGDYSTNAAFVLARANHRNPEEVGKEIINAIKTDEDLNIIFGRVEFAKPGFVNFFLKNEFLQNTLAEIYQKIDSFGLSDVGKSKTVIVEYSSPNIAKPMHVGHLRSTIIGDALANIYEALGYKVIRWNYIGDWGTQFGKLIVAYNDLVSRLGKTEADIQFFGNDTTLGMVGHYVRYHKDYQDDQKAREEFKKLEDGEPTNRKLWEKIKKISLKELTFLVYPGIGVDAKRLFFKGESDYEDELKPLIAYLVKNNITQKSEGALIIDLEKYNLPPALLRKSDGTTLYFTRDLASLKDRIENPEFHHPAKILYVVANQQTLHFKQLFAVASELKLNSSELTHVKFGMVLGEDGKKLATREGKVILLQDVVNKIIKEAYDLVKYIKFANEGISESEAQNIANTVGIAALKYNDLRQHPYSDITFDWNAMLNLRSNSGPYLQYTYARLANILEKVGSQKDGDASLLVEPEEEKIMKRLLKFPDAIMKCAEFNTLNGLALYLYELSSEANHFYESIRVLEDENINRRNARLMLVETVAVVLKRGLGLLGISVLKRI